MNRKISLRNFIKFSFAALLVLVSNFPYNEVRAASLPPTILSYQGRLADSGGNLLGGAGTTYYFKFSLWDSPTVGAGNRVWPTSVPATTTATVRQGVFTVNIGDTANGYPDPLNINFANYPALYVQVEVSSDNNSSETLSPRQRLTSAVYAQVSGSVVGTTTPSLFGTTTPAASSFVTIQATSSTAVPLSILGALSQTANLFQIQNNALQNIFSISSAGAVAFSGALTSTANTAHTLPFASSTALTVSGTASTSILFATNATTTTFGITGITSGNLLKTSTGGTIVAAVAGTDYATPAQVSAVFPFTPNTNYGANANSTSTPIWFTAGLQASSTSRFEYASTTAITSTNASTTNFTISSVASGNLLKTTTAGSVIAAVAGTDFATPSQITAAFPYTPGTNFATAVNSTSTIINFTQGIFASSTSRFSGISTISASTTNLLSTGSSTIAGQLNAVGGATLGTVTAGATTLSSLTLSGLNGPLDVRNGVVSATTSIGVLYGGTGLTSAPSLGQLLLGQTNGTYALTSTSSLGLLSSTSIVASAPLSYNTTTGGLTITQATGATNGYLSATDYTFFNNKISSSSLAQIFPFTPGTNFATAVNSTSTIINFTQGIFASTTSRFEYASTTMFSAALASSTSLIVSGLNAANCDLKSTNGVISCGTDSTGTGGSFPYTPTTFGSTAANATSTLIGFTQGIYALASSTIGNGAQNGGLTISGGATTTGNAYVAGTLNISQFGSYQQNGTSILYASSTSNSVAVGVNAGYKLLTDTSATYNVAVGSDSLTNGSLTGDRNNAIGAQSLFSLTTASQNQAMGVAALYTLADGWNNVGIGDGAGYYNQSGAANVYLGYQAGYGNAGQSQNNNVGVGYRSLYKVTGSAGTSNIAVGYQAGYGITSGANNIALGAFGTTDVVTSGSNNILIGQDVQIGITPTASNQFNIGNLIFGTGLSSGTTLANGKIGFATTSPFAPLSVHANNGLVNPVLFAVGSSTQTATSTLFSIDNTGLTTILKLSATGATTSALAVTASTTIAGQLNAVGGATLGTLTAGATTLSSLTLGSLSGLIAGNSGATYAAATSSVTCSGGISCGTTSYVLGGALSITNAIGFPFTQGTFGSTNANSTTTLIGFTQGIYSLASSTIGNGNQEGGLTISGGATTTGTLYVGSKIAIGTTTPDSALTLVGGTTAAAGIRLGDDVNLYRSAANILKSDDELHLGSAFIANVALSTQIKFANTGVIQFGSGTDTNIFRHTTQTLRTNSSFIADGKTGIGTTSPYALLSVFASSTTGLVSPTVLFAIGSTTGGNSTTTLFAIDNIGNSSLFGTASSSALIVSGLNQASCDVKSTNGVLSCGTDATGTGSSFPYTPTTFGSTAANATTTSLMGFTQGIYSLASSTIGDGSQAGGLTVSGGATTTGKAYFASSVSIGSITPTNNSKFYVQQSTDTNVSGIMIVNSAVNRALHLWVDNVNRGHIDVGSTGGDYPVLVNSGSTGGFGVGTTSPWGFVSINPNAFGSGPSFVVGSSTKTDFIVTNAGSVGMGTTTPYAIFSLHAASTTIFTPTLFVISSSTPQFATSTHLIVTSNGNTGIATSSPSQLFALNVGGSTLIGSGPTSVLTLNVGQVNRIAATTTIPTQPNAYSIATSTAAGNGPVFSISGNSATTTISFFGATTTALAAGGGLGLTSNLKNMMIIGNGKTIASVAIVKGSICVDNDGWCTASTTATGANGGGEVAARHYTTAGTDLAEMYWSTTELAAGAIVQTTGSTSIDVATRENGKAVLGVISTVPGISLGGMEDLPAGAGSAYPVALSGRVPVVVSLENGPIGVGDKITISSVAGMGMKAGPLDVSVGIALEPFAATSTATTTSILMFLNLRDEMDGKVLAAAIASSTATTSEEILLAGPFASAAQIVKTAIHDAFSTIANLAQIGIKEIGTAVHAGLGVFDNLISQTITTTVINADTVNAKMLCIDGLCVTKSQLQNLLNGQSANPAPPPAPEPQPEPEPEPEPETSPTPEEPENPPAENPVP